MFDTDNRGAVTWAEIDALFKALGMPILTPELLKEARSPWNPSNTEALDYEAFMQILESTAFQKLHSFNYNRHGSEYNTRCIKMCISLLARRDPGLQVADLKKARMSFFLYEGESTHGIELDDKTVQASLRLSGRMVAPKKLHVFLMVFRPILRRRMQFYEFLDLLQYTVRRPDLNSRPSPADNIGVERNEDGVYDLVSAEAFMHPDERLIAKLNERYETETRQMISRNAEADENEKKSTQASQFPFVNKYRSRLDKQLKSSTRTAEKNKKLYNDIQNSMRLSKQEVNLSRTATFRPQTAREGPTGRRPGTASTRPGSSRASSRPGSSLSSRPSSRYQRHDGMKNLNPPVHPRPPSSKPKQASKYPATRPRTAPPPRRDMVVSSEQFETRLRRMGELVQAEIDYIPQSSEQDIVIADPNIEFALGANDDDIIHAQNAVFEPMLLPPHLRKTRPVKFPTPQEYFRDEMFSFKVTDDDADFSPSRAYAKGRPPPPSHPMFANQRQGPDSAAQHFTTQRGQMRTDSGTISGTALGSAKSADRDRRSGLASPFTIRDRPTEDPEAPMSAADRAALEHTTARDGPPGTPSRYIANQGTNEFEKWEDLRTKYSRHRSSEQFYKRAKSAIMMRALERNSPFVEPPRPKSAIMAKVKKQKEQTRANKQKEKAKVSELEAKHQQRLEDVEALVAAHHRITAQQREMQREQHRQQALDEMYGYDEEDSDGDDFSYYSESRDGSEFLSEADSDADVPTDGLAPADTSVLPDTSGLDLSPMSVGGLPADEMDMPEPPEDALMDYYVTRLMSARGGRTTRDRPQTAMAPRVDASTPARRPQTSLGTAAAATSSREPIVPPLQFDFAATMPAQAQSPQQQDRIAPHKPASARPYSAKIAAARPQSARRRILGRQATTQSGQSSATPARPQTARTHAALLKRHMTPKSGVRAHHAPARKFELVSKQWAAAMFKEKKAKTMLKFAGDSKSFSSASYRADDIHEDLAPGGSEIPPQKLAGARDIGSTLVAKKAGLVATARAMANVHLLRQPDETAFLETSRSLPVTSR